MNYLKQTGSIRCWAMACISMVCLTGQPALAGDRHVFVAESFLEMRTGPGRGYPIFHIAEQGEPIIIVKRRPTGSKSKQQTGTGSKAGCTFRK